MACGKVQLAGEEKRNVRLRSAAVHVGIVRSDDEKSRDNLVFENTSAIKMPCTCRSAVFIKIA